MNCPVCIKREKRHEKKVAAALAAGRPAPRRRILRSPCSGCYSIPVYSRPCGVHE